MSRYWKIRICLASNFFNKNKKILNLYNDKFITLAGFHMNALASEKFAKAFKDKKMAAYVEKV